MSVEPVMVVFLSEERRGFDLFSRLLRKLLCIPARTVSDVLRFSERRFGF